MNGNLNAALILLDRALEEIESGFVRRERCGDQEDTKDLDFVDDLKAAKSELLALLNNELKARKPELLAILNDETTTD